MSHCGISLADRTTQHTGKLTFSINEGKEGKKEIEGRWKREERNDAKTRR
jgi:hypothetical protein